MASFITVRIPKKIKLEEVNLCKEKKRLNKKHKKKTNKKPESKDVDHSQFDHSCNTISTEDSFSENEHTIFIDPVITYASELEKIQGIILLDQSFRSFVLPDFHTEKRQLSLTKCRLVNRRRVFVETDQPFNDWLYTCSCDLTKRDFVNALPDVIISPLDEKDYCIHVYVVQMVVPTDDELSGIDEDITDKNGVFLKNVHFCNDRLIVIVDGDVGVVEGFNKKNRHCQICSSTFCQHCVAVKETKGTEDDDELAEILNGEEKIEDDHLHSCNSLSFDLSEEEKKIINSCPTKVFGEKTIGSEKVFVAQFQLDESCINCDTLFDYSENRPYKLKYLLYRNQMYSCAVYDLTCNECKLCCSYDGKEHCVLHYGNFLIHHSVLRDYMFHFLNGNSCTLHGFFEVWRQHQEDNGNTSFSQIFRYDTWRRVWYHYLSLVSDGIESFENFKCQTCGPEPSTVVCDATSLGFQRKYLTFRKTTVEDEIIPRMSTLDSRIAIPSKAARDELKNWCSKKMKPSEVSKVKSALTPYPNIYDVFVWALTSFPVSLPAELKRFFSSLAQPSAVCCLIPPTESNFLLLERIFHTNIKRDVQFMQQLHASLPLFYQVLCSIFESSLPRIWKPLIQDLILVSLKPFQTRDLKDYPPAVEDPLEFFPSLPLKRGRGRYEMDKESDDGICNKFYRGHPKLTPGIFTVFCPHGINYGFQVMRCVESPNTPFTIFKTRFQKAPKIIIYDNACNLQNYCLNRNPIFFRETQFLVDRFHWPNHRGCSIAYHISMYPTLKNINSQINEQQNSAVKKLKTQLSYMTPVNFVNHCKFFLWHRNQLKEKKHLINGNRK